MFTDKSVYIDEPKLLFKGEQEAYNPQVGLLKFGPRTKSNESVETINLGIIGSNQSISQVMLLLRKMKSPVKPDKKITRYRLPFPGFSKDSKFKMELVLQRRWQEKLTFNEINNIRKEEFEYRTDLFTKYVFEKINILYSKYPPPDIIILSIPAEIMNICKKLGVDKPKLKLSNDDDFHDRIKLFGMNSKIPTQIIRPETLLQKNTQDISLICWNLGVAIIYKSQRGFPWKLTYLEENTCYVGISFYKEIHEDQDFTRTSLAQVFLESGESFILRGDSFIWDNKKYPNSPHLDKDGAKKLIKQVIDQYFKYKKLKPNRLVIHKTSSYWEEELEGFLEGTENIGERDFVTIYDNSNLKFYREDKWFTSRGLLLSYRNRSEHYLYTTGYNPYLRTYIGYGVPKPLRIKTYTDDPPILKICEEILSFSKLDWNNTYFNSKLPLTLEVSKKLGRILANSYAKQIDIDPHYYYYM